MTSTRRSRRRWASTTRRWSSTSSSARTPWCGRWSPPARPTTTSRSRGTPRPTSTTRWARWSRNEPATDVAVQLWVAGGEVDVSRHTLSVLVENKPGVLARVASLFSRRGFNIDSLAVGPTEHPEISRMTIVVNVDELPLEQVQKQLNKLVNVIKLVARD